LAFTAAWTNVNLVQSLRDSAYETIGGRTIEVST
jgi:hypothetical protein